MYYHISKSILMSTTHNLKSFTSRNIQLDDNTKLFYIDSGSKLISIIYVKYCLGNSI